MELTPELRGLQRNVYVAEQAAEEAKWEASRQDEIFASACAAHLAAAWYEALGRAPVPLVAIFNQAKLTSRANLMAAVHIACHRSLTPNAHVLSAVLKRYVDTHLEGLCFRCHRRGTAPAQWWVEPVVEATP